MDIESVNEEVKDLVFKLAEENNIPLTEAELAEGTLEKILNSLYFINFVTKLEKKFNIEFDDDDLDNTLFPTFRSVVEKVYEMVNDR